MIKSRTNGQVMSGPLKMSLVVSRAKDAELLLLLFVYIPSKEKSK